MYLQVRQTLDDILDKVPEPFSLLDMAARVDERTPYVIVSFQECERMNVLMNEIRRSLKELQLGLKVLGLLFEIVFTMFVKKMHRTILYYLYIIRVYLILIKYRAS